jgi:hypothetical protein
MCPHYLELTSSAASDRERPTSRAISERLFKIRNSVKNSTGTASLTVSNGAKPSPSKSAVEANNKHATSKETSVKKPVVNGKRKRGAERYKSIQTILCI